MLNNAAVPPRQEFVNPVDQIADALLHKTGNLGGLLALAEMTEREQFDHAGAILESLGLTVKDLMGAQVEALRWSNGIVEETGR